MKYIFLVFRIVQTGRLVSSLNISSILRIDSCHVSARFSSIPHETKVTLRSARDRMKNHPNHRSKHNRCNIQEDWKWQDTSTRRTNDRTNGYLKRSYRRWKVSLYRLRRKREMVKKFVAYKLGSERSLIATCFRSFERLRDKSLEINSRFYMLEKFDFKKKTTCIDLRHRGREAIFQSKHRAYLKQPFHTRAPGG